MNSNPIRAVLVAAAMALAFPVAAQAPAPTTSDMEIFVQKVKADKKLIVAAEMKLTDGEAKAFWPLYDEYQAGLAAINQRMSNVVIDYGAAYNKGMLPEATAGKLRDEAIAIEEAEVKLKRDFAPRLDKAVGQAKAARYYQIESKIRAVLRYELAAAIPVAN